MSEASRACSAVADAVGAYHYRFADEYQLQEGLDRALKQRGLIVEREVRLAPRDRIDMLVFAGSVIGVEVKVAGNQAAVARQVQRYLDYDRIDGLVLVTSRVRHQMPDTVKPLQVVCLVAQGL